MIRSSASVDVASLHIGSGHLSVVLPAEVTFNGRARPFAAQNRTKATVVVAERVLSSD